MRCLPPPNHPAHAGPVLDDMGNGKKETGVSILREPWARDTHPESPARSQHTSGITGEPYGRGVGRGFLGGEGTGPELCIPIKP